MQLLKAETQHLDQMTELVDMARVQIKRLGFNQWQTGYPPKELLEEDIRQGRAFLAEEGGIIMGMFVYQTFPDPSYAQIDGRWLTEGDDYASVHRVCVSDACKGRGVAGWMMAQAFSMARQDRFCSVRIDTHEENLPMQRALSKAGFQRCGVIRLIGGPEDGDPRIAFEMVLTKA